MLKSSHFQSINRFRWLFLWRRSKPPFHIGKKYMKEQELKLCCLKLLGYNFPFETKSICHYSSVVTSSCEFFARCVLLDYPFIAQGATSLRSVIKGSGGASPSPTTEWRMSFVGLCQKVHKPCYGSQAMISHKVFCLILIL